jgi:hypothetical protein
MSSSLITTPWAFAAPGELTVPLVGFLFFSVELPEFE